MNNGTLVALKEPLVSRGLLKTKVIEVVKLRRPVVKDLLGLDFSPHMLQASMVILVSRLSDVSQKDLLEMNLHDWTKLSSAVNDLVVGESA